MNNSGGIFGPPRPASSQAPERYQSALIERMWSGGYRLSVPPFTFHLAREFGFCYGVDEAIRAAYETRKRFPDRRIFLTNEIIHNPRVNQDLRDLGIRFLGGEAGIGEIAPEDIVIIPAFGSPAEEMERLARIGCTLVDTTCGSVVAVWKRVEKYAREGFTSVIHGRYDHEEIRATCSRVLPSGGHYLVVRDIGETGMIARFIETGRDGERIARDFKKASSSGFDPEQHLLRVGCANQTTMLSSESLAVAGMIRTAMIRRYGGDKLKEHFRSFDTVCSATQDRQDAIRKLLEEKPLDLVFVIGGFNSSNTAHLAKIAAEKVPGFHISGPQDLISLETIHARPPGRKDAEILSGWFPPRSTRIGITAGASTPNRVIEDVIRRFLELQGLQV